MGSRVFLSFFILVGCAQSIRAAELVTSYELTGSFARNGERSWLPWIRSREGVVEFDSYGGSDTRTGKLRTGVFVLPAEIHLFVAGSPSLVGMRVYLADEKRNRSLDLSNRVDPGAAWRMHYWRIPKEWQGASVRMIVEDNGTAPGSWVGVTLPQGGGEPVPVSLGRAVEFNGLLVVFGLLFLLPGLAGCALLGRRNLIFDLKTAVSAVLIISSVCALGVFCVYLLGPKLGRPASLLLLMASGVIAGVYRRNIFKRQTSLRLELAACLAAVLLAAIFNCSVGYLYTTDEGYGEYAQVRYVAGMPPDNLLPNMFAQKLYHGISVRPRLFEFWQSSDRPPLQTAIVLMEKRLFSENETVPSYQLLGIFLQSLWMAAVWVLLRTSGLKVQSIAFCLAAFLFSYFCLFNTFYVWAKLLAASFYLLSLSFFPFVRGGGPWTTTDALFAGALLGLSMLCHPGVAFTIAGTLLVAALSGNLPPLRIGLAGAGAILLFLLPWQAYQKFYDPPGDNLMKLHLAGVVDFQHTLTQCILGAYRKITLQQWALGKLANVRALFYGNFEIRLFPWDPGRILRDFIEANFFTMSYTLGLLNAGFLVRIWKRGPVKLVRLGGWFLTFAAVSLVIWCLVMFTPGSTVIHAGSYATAMLLFLGLSIWLVGAAPKLAVVLLAIQIVAIFPIFVFARPLFVKPGTLGDAPLDLAMSSVAIASLAGFALLYRRCLLARDLYDAPGVMESHVKRL